MSVIDCHQHFWTFGKRVHKFPPAVGTRLDRDFTPAILRPQLSKAGIDGTILVQVLNELGETYEFLDMQREIDFVVGVVGWLPLTDPAACARELEGMKQRGKLVGIRPLIAYEPDPDWLLQPSVRESLGLLAKAATLGGDVAVLGMQTYLAVADDAKHKASLEENPLTDADMDALGAAGI